MNIIVAGIGKIGSTLAEHLTGEGHNVTVIDVDAAALNACVERYDLIGVCGNCASMHILKQAEITKNNLLIAATGSDEVNLLCCLTANGMNSDIHTMARIRSPQYAEQAYAMRELFALSVIFNPEKQAAQEIHRLLKYPGFLKRDSFAKGRVEIVELRIDKNSKLAGVPLMKLNDIVRCKVLVCVVARSGETFIPSGTFVLEEGDRIFVTAPTDVLSTLLKNLGIVTHKVKRVILMGGGTISYYLAELLEKDKIDVEIIEKDLPKAQQLSQRLSKTRITHGDVTDQSLLDSVGIADCDAMVALTGIDEMNMILSLYASGCGVSQVITKISRGEDNRITDSLPLGSVVRPKALCSANIVRYVRAMENQTGAAVSIHAIADGRAEAIEFIADQSTLHCGIPLKDLKLKSGVLIVGITRRGHIEIPSGNSIFLPGDNLVIVSAGTHIIMNLNDIFE